MLARALQARGFRAAFAGEARYLQDPAVAAPGEFGHWPLADFTMEAAFNYLRKTFYRPGHAFLRQQVQDELAVLEASQPRLVVCDFRLTSYISARLKGVPVVSLLGGRWLLQYAPEPIEPARSHPSYPLLKRFCGPWLFRSAALPLQLRLLRWKLAPYRAVAKEHGLNMPRDIWDWFIGDHNLVLDTETMGPTLPLPSHFTRVGPITWNPDMALPEWIRELDPAKPLVYVTMGSTGDPDLFHQIIGLLAGLDCHGVISTGGQLELDAASLPRNIRAAKFLPGVEVMKRAALVIFHGGAGTAYQAIAAGTPAIVIATHFEQEFAGLVFERHGAGQFHTMRETRADPAPLAEGVREMLANPAPYRAGVDTLRQDYLRHDPINEAADCISEFLAKGGH